MTPWNWSTTWLPSQTLSSQKLYSERGRVRDVQDETVGSRKRLKVHEPEVDEVDDQKAETDEDTIPIDLKNSKHGARNPGVREEEFLFMWGPDALMGEKGKALRFLWKQLAKGRQDEILKTGKFNN